MQKCSAWRRLGKIKPVYIASMSTGAKLDPETLKDFYETLAWARNLDPNTCQFYTLYQLGAHRTDPSRIEGANKKGPQESPFKPDLRPESIGH